MHNFIANLLPCDTGVFKRKFINMHFIINPIFYFMFNRMNVNVILEC